MASTIESNPYWQCWGDIEELYLSLTHDLLMLVDMKNPPGNAVDSICNMAQAKAQLAVDTIERMRVCARPIESHEVMHSISQIATQELQTTV